MQVNLRIFSEETVLLQCSVPISEFGISDWFRMVPRDSQEKYANENLLAVRILDGYDLPFMIW